MNQTTFEGAKITCLGHDGFLVEIEKPAVKFAFDPFEVHQDLPVDYIFISHHHYDHCDPASLRRMITPKTKIIIPIPCQRELSEFNAQLEVIADKEKHQFAPLICWTVPAYNINKFRTPSEVFHPQEMGGVGFVVEVEGLRFYHAGDTDVIPEMETLKKIDVAFLPISGTFVMTSDEAVQAAAIINPKLVIPMHFGKIIGSVAEANRFANLLREKTPVTVLSSDPFA